jgi:hypothetical protein
VVSGEWLSTKNRATALRQELESDVVAGRIGTVDAAKQQAYIRGMRRSIRPFFPAPSPECRPLAESLLRDATQKGVLDFPALVHAPIEKWLVSHLCRTRITPNQILTDEVKAALGDLAPALRREIGYKLFLLEEDLRGDVEKLKGSFNEYRLRVAEHRQAARLRQERPLGQAAQGVGCFTVS